MAAQQDSRDAGNSHERETTESEHASSTSDFVARATAKYAQKQYREAAELYSQATELQAEEHGEMSPLNADLLFCYGRCLYHVAIQNSDVLGSKVVKEAPSEPRSSERDAPGAVSGSLSKAAPTNGQSLHDNDARPKGQAANLQFIGDENYVDSDEDPEGDVAPSDHAEEEDDFSNAFEILDLARVLLSKSLQETATPQSSGDHREDDNKTTRLKERLADTYDLQAEISLEGEQFPSAVRDLQAALDIRTQIYPSHSNIVAETHYKLSLALEFVSASPTQAEAGIGNAEHTGPSAGHHLRKEAIEHMEAAITSCTLRIAREEDRLAASLAHAQSGTAAKNSLREEIDDVKDMVREMKQRLSELRQSPSSASQAATEALDEQTLRGVLSHILKEAPQEQQARLAQAAEQATDVTGLVKRKKHHQRKENASESQPSASKRKAEIADIPSGPDSSKRTKPADSD